MENFYILLGKSSLLWMAKYWNNKIAIWSHWLLPKASCWTYFSLYFLLFIVKIIIFLVSVNVSLCVYLILLCSLISFQFFSVLYFEYLAYQSLRFIYHFYISISIYLSLSTCLYLPSFLCYLSLDISRYLSISRYL